jgi:hypothetical protein
VTIAPATEGSPDHRLSFPLGSRSASRCQDQVCGSASTNQTSGQGDGRGVLRLVNPGATACPEGQANRMAASTIMARESPWPRSPKRAARPNTGAQPNDKKRPSDLRKRLFCGAVPR